MALDETTEELARGAAQGDHRALGELLKRIEPDVLRHCGRILPYRQDAEEASQDTLLAVARNIGRFEGRARFSTWLHIVTANCARTTYRSLKRRSAEQGSEDLPLQKPDVARVSVIAGSRLDLLDAMEALEAEKPDWPRRWCCVTSASSTTTRWPSSSASRSAPPSPASIRRANTSRAPWATPTASDPRRGGRKCSFLELSKG